MGNLPDFCRNISLNNETTSFALQSECWHEKWIADFLRKSLPLIILPLSLICNSLSFAALRSRHMRGTSTAFFMLALSVLDPLVLLTKNLVYFPTLVPAHAISCKILYFFIYVLGYTNVWILVIMTADKFFAVWFPLKVSYFCTISRAKHVCILLVAMTSIISFHHFWTINSFKHAQKPQQRFCYYDTHRYVSIQRIWRYFDFVIWCFLPFILILTLSVLIIYKLRQKQHASHQNIRHIINANISSSTGGTSSTRISKSQRSSQQPRKSSLKDLEMRSNQKTDVIRSRHRHITLMLLAVAGVFLLLTLPNSVYFVLDLTYGFHKQPTKNDYYQWLRYRRLTIITVIMFQLSDLQHAVNFFMYLLTSDKFRRSVMMICQSSMEILLTMGFCWRQKNTRDSSSLSFQNSCSQNKRKGQNQFRSSTSEISSTIGRQSTKFANQQQQQQHEEKTFYKYRSLGSKVTIPGSREVNTTTTTRCSISLPTVN